MKETIAMASDHAGYEYKEMLKLHLETKGFRVKDFGTYSTEANRFKGGRHRRRINKIDL
ncbi:MAG: RpiB/LacA/LacB family sugar-phosphate isomerase [Spirochaetales bacterium]|nr:RpiB/LacA/LacB family sugar-phosphate isomerase [Spirochaetales bacterium]